MAFSLTWLPEVLLAENLKVAEVEGWASRGRSEMGKVRGVMLHHTAGPREGNMPSLRILRDGREDLAGPLAQLGLGRDGTYYVVAAGRANHAGKGEWRGIRSGNSSFIGIEVENNGRGEQWPDVQMDACRRGVAALLRHIGALPAMCCGHKEYAPGRKPDPAAFDMKQFRDDVAQLLAGQGEVRPLIPAVDAATGMPTLRRGDRGEEVKTIQAAVGVTADGRFGAGTEAAVRRFQARNALVPDGIVGPKSWARILQ